MSTDVIFVSNALANGGAARVLTLLANKFASQRAVKVISFQPYEKEYSLDPGVVKTYAPRGSSVLAKVRRILWIRNAIKASPTATVVSFEYFVNMQVIIACLGLRNRVVVSERNDPGRAGNRFPIRTLRSLLYRMADVVVCQTTDAAAYFPSRIRTDVILNPVLPDLPTVEHSRRRKTVVTFCRLEPQKNLGMLIEAFSIFAASQPDYTLEIYGDGPERQKIIESVESAALSSKVTVAEARSDIHAKVKDCTMFVLPSNYEGLSNSMLEAMAMGLPVVCTDCPCGGARAVITHGENGLLVPVGSVDALVEAMVTLADDSDLRSRLGSAAMHVREQLSLDSVSAAWERVMVGAER